MKIIDNYLNRKSKEIFLISLNPYLNRKFAPGFVSDIENTGEFGKDISPNVGGNK